jgi:hypothetical protein
LDKEKNRVYEILKSLLENDETVSYHLAERRLGGARIFEPAHVFTTNKKIIIIRGGILHIHQDFKIINYGNITEIVLENGILFSRLHFTLQGESTDPNEKKWLVGLKYKEALELVRFVNTMIEKPAQGGTKVI